MFIFFITISLIFLVEFILFLLLKWNSIDIIKYYKQYFIINLVIILILIISAIVVGNPSLSFIKYRFYFFWLAIYLILLIPKICFTLFLFFRKGISVFKNKFLNIIVFNSGIVLSFVLILLFIHGIFIGKTNYKVFEKEIYLYNLPHSFNGTKIIQLSDIHLGSFSDTTYMSKIVDTVNALHPDLIVLTGDMVNILSDEAIPFIPIFKRLHAKYGVYSILGNHDIRDYRKFDSVKATFNDIAKLIEIEKKMGLTILLDSNVVLRKGADSIALLGVENWGLPPFKQTGNLEKALKGVESVPFKILLSHDPTHWRAQVLNKTTIALMLAGHTHGMQFGIRTSWFQWSPSKYKYPEYMGLYEKNNQYLYVNVGIGFIGFAGRVGIYPEISVITLKSK